MIGCLQSHRNYRQDRLHIDKLKNTTLDKKKGIRITHEYLSRVECARKEVL